MISDNVVFIQKRIGESDVTLSDTSKMQNVFGWKATTGLDQWIIDNL